MTDAVSRWTTVRCLLALVTGLGRAALLLLTAAAVHAANPVQIENTKPGTTAWQLINPATNREIEGYASLTSVNRGDSIRLFVNTAELTYTLRIFRLGWYGGAGAREMMPAVTRAGTAQPIPAPDPTTGLVECDWRDPYLLTIPSNPADPSDWASGVYLAQLTAGQSGKQSYIIFVVRDDARPSTFLFQSSVTTFQAYNNWGGKSLYPFNSAGGPARKVSFNRPYAGSTNPVVAVGTGAGQFFSAAHSEGYGTSPAAWECNMLRWLEREGYDVTYDTDIDTHANGALLLAHRGFLAVGHDEYWTWQMRANVTAARDAGVSLGFFSGNTCYWQCRFEPSPLDGASNRTMVGYKDAAATLDPLAVDGSTANDILVTSRWREFPVYQSEDALLGVMYDFDPVDADMVIADAAHWVCAGTGLHNGDALPGLVGYEVDRFWGSAPSAVSILAHSPYLGGGTTRYSDMTVYTAPSGATVFATGSIQWAWGLDDFNAPTLRPSRLNAAAQQITRNVLARFAAPLPPRPAPVSTLTDDFDDSLRDPARWVFGTIRAVIPAGMTAWDPVVPVLERNGHLEIAPRANACGRHFSGYLSSPACDLTGGSASVEVVQVAGASGAVSQMALCLDRNNFYELQVEAGRLYASQVVAGAKSTVSVVYSPTQQRFWRIRHEAATDRILFETSPDRLTWTTQRALARQFPITALTVELSAGTYTWVTSPGTAVYDNFRLEPAGALPPNLPPVANAGGPYRTVAGQSLTFNGTGSADPDGVIAGYRWDFGDGAAGSGPTPAHTYAAPGAYTVTLTVTDDRGATGTAAVPVTVDAPPILSGFFDDFNDNARDPAKWTYGTIRSATATPPSAWDPSLPVLEQNGRLEITPLANADGRHFNGYLSVSTHDLTGAGASVEIVQVAGGGSTDTQFALCIDRNNLYVIQTEAGRLYLTQVVGGVKSAASVGYSPTQQRFWRIRHEAATDRILFETSPDRLTWTIQRALARQLPITALTVELSAGTYIPAAAPGTAVFDNFRLETGP